MATQLYDWQVPSKDALVAGFATGAACMVNASDTGTGKTLVAIQTLKELGRQALVICPKGVKSSWRYWSSELGVPGVLLDVTNPERIVRDRTPYWTNGKWTLPAGVLAVVDEFHRGCSGMDSKLTKAIALLKAYHVPVLAQSATIACNPLNMRALGFLLNQHAFGKSSFYDWCLRNGCVRGYNNAIEFPKGPKAEQAMLELHKKLAPYMVRVRVADVAGFPESCIETRLIDLSEQATREVNEEYTKALAEVAKHPHVPDPRVFLLRARQKAEIMKVPALLDMVDDAVAEGNSVVIFVSFIDTLKLLMHSIPHAKVAVWGRPDDPDGSKRDMDIAAFQRNEAVVCVAQIGAGGVGVSLHDVRQERPRRSLITPSFTASEVKQALGRIHRSGGTRVVQTFVLAAGTIEERVNNALQGKLRCIETLIDGALSVF
jgi:hypothetical protein